MQRILIIQTAFFGDVILATPLVRACHEKYPSASIDVLVKKGNEALLANHPLISKVYTFDKTRSKWRNMWRLIQVFRANKYDWVINLHRYASSGLITAFSGGKKTSGFSKNPFSFLYATRVEHKIGDGTHEVERNVSLLGIHQKRRPELYPSAEDRGYIEQWVVPNYFCLAPASVWFTKQLPEEKWTQLVEKLSIVGDVYLLGSSVDVHLCERIRMSAGVANCMNLAGKLSMLQSAALMEKATRNYVNDSAPLHIASAMNAPVTAFFCSTVPEFGFGPLSDDFKIAQVENLACRPCGIHGYNSCPKGHFSCGKAMEIT